MTFLSLFSGIEAASVAWEPLGWRPAAFSEIDSFPSALLNYRYPAVPNLGDAAAVDWSQYRGKVDVLVGGSPCQAFSVAGLRKSLEDPRGNLTLEYVRAVHAIRPRYAVWENVPGVLSTNDNAFGCFLGALVGSYEAIMAPKGHPNRRGKWVQKWFSVAHDVPGKRRWRRHEMFVEWTSWSRVGVVTGPIGTASWRIFDAQYFGLAQRRERVFVVFSPGNRVDPGEILLEFESMRRDSPPSRTQGQSIAHGIAGSAGSGSEWPAEISPPLNTSWADRSAGSQAQEWDSEKGGRFVPDVGYALNAKGGGGTIDGESETFVAEIAGTLGAGDGSRGWRNDLDQGAFLPVAHALRADGFDASEDGTGRVTPLVPVSFHGTQDPCANYGDTAPTIGRNQGQEACIAFYPTGGTHGVSASADVSPSIKVGSGVGIPSSPAIAYNLRDRNDGSMPEPTDVASIRAASGGSSRTYVGVRRLTPTECERLQGFPDGYTAIPFRGKPAADGPRYKALGNSFAVPVIRWIGRRIMAAEAGGK